MLETPDEIVNQLMKVWNDEDEQLRIILQYRLKEDNVVEDLAALRSILEGLKQEGGLSQSFPYCFLFLLRHGSQVGGKAVDFEPSGSHRVQ